jgi:CDP-4-dehydro-6-deoxyglucose reductase
LSEGAVLQQGARVNAGRDIKTCVSTPLTDIGIYAENLFAYKDIPVITTPCRVSKVQYENANIVRLWLRLPPSSSFKFVPGQFIYLIKDGLRRAYSLASADNHLLELHIKRIEGGVLSDYLFDEIKLNDLLRLEGPFGTFGFRDKGYESVVFIATGTGIAPIRAIIQSLNFEELPIRFHLFWGVKSPSDLYLDFESYTPHLSVHNVFSRSKSGAHLEYVQEALTKSDIDLSSSQFYVCGSEHMVGDVLKTLQFQGVGKDQCEFDVFLPAEVM